MIYSTAALVPSAVICTKGATESTTVTVNVGDTLTDVVLAGGRHDVTIASATVKGLIGGNKIVRRGENTIWDGIPTHLRDEEGDSHFGTIDELMDIRQLVVEVTPEEEGAAPEIMKIRIADIKAITVTPAADGGTSGSTTTE